MPIGARRSRGVLQSPPGTQDAIGQPTTTYTDVATIYGDLRHLSGIESIKAGADTSVVKASLRIHHREGVTAGWRYVAGGTTYNVTAVLDDQRARKLDLVLEVVS